MYISILFHITFFAWRQWLLSSLISGLINEANNGQLQQQLEELWNINTNFVD